MIADIVKTDGKREFISSTENGKLQSFYIPDMQFSILGKFIIFRLKENRDVKILITGSGKTTGTGKTTLAILLARYVNSVRNHLFNEDTDWSTEEYSFMNTWEYLENYRDANPGDPLITDELEYMADRRRHMTDENVFFGQAWSVLRWKNAVTIGTAPGLTDLEKRIPEGADIWLNVVHKGCANTYYLTMHDFEQRPIYKRLRMNGYKESILWNPIENDEDYQYLSDKKKEIGVPGLDSTGYDGGDTYDEKDINSMEKDIRNANVKRILQKLKELGFYDKEEQQFKRFSQEDLADVCDVSQPQVSKIKREMEAEGEL